MTSINPNYSSAVFNVNNSNNQKIQSTRVNVETQPDGFVSAKKDKKNKAKKIAIAAAIVAVAATITGIVLYKKGIINFKKIKTLSDIEFKGKSGNREAILKKNGKKFTGQINHNFDDGSSITTKYKNGVLTESVKFETPTHKYGTIKKYIHKDGNNIIQEGTVGFNKNGKRTVKMQKETNYTEQKKFIQNAIKEQPLKLDLTNVQNDTKLGVYTYTYKDQIGFREHFFNNKSNFSLFDNGSYKKSELGTQVATFYHNANSTKVIDKNKDFISAFIANSPNGKLTDTQKALIALDAQNLHNSPNSPIGKLYKINSEKEAFDMISKWSKDINLNDKKTRVILKQIENHPNDNFSSFSNFKTFLNEIFTKNI